MTTLAPAKPYSPAQTHSPAKPAAPRRVFIRSINYFRGVAILFIVLGHCVTASGWEVDTFPERLVANILIGATPLFLFISGFLFHYIYYPKFNYGQFLKKKVENVLIPYLIMSVFAVRLVLFYEKLRPYPKVFYPDPQGHGFLAAAVPIVKYVWTGALMTGYWYIPFIMVMFLMAPLHVSIIRWPLRRQVSLITALLAVSLVIQRPPDSIGVFRNVLYFFPIYVLGMICSVNKEKIYAFLKNRDWMFGVAALLLAGFQSAHYDAIGNFHKTFFSYQGIDLQMLQKLALCFFFMGFLHRFENVEIKALEYFASASFAIYFIHPWFLHVIRRLTTTHPIDGVSGAIVVPGLTLSILGGAVLTAEIIKRIFGKNSRRIIGW